MSGRINSKVSIAVEAYQLGAENSKERLRALARQTLDEFGLQRPDRLIPRTAPSGPWK